MEQRIYEAVSSFEGLQGVVVSGLAVHQDDGNVFEALRGLTQEIDGQDGDTDGVSPRVKSGVFLCGFAALREKKCLASFI